MIFSTPLFIFGFLPIFLGIYYLVPSRLRTLVILLGSCLFYGWWKATYLLLVLAIAALSYVCGALSHHAEAPALRSWAVRLGVLGNLAILGWFKYAYFIAGSFDDAIVAFGGVTSAGVSLPEIILPIGLSFLVFQSISYILDVARGDAPPARNLIDFLAFSTLFPQLIAGPILRYKDLADQIVTREHSLPLFASGARRFVTGLAMKVVIADSVAPLVDRLFLLQTPTLAEAWLAALAYSVQLFFDFAGYSAMAIGLGLMIGFRFVENFNAPYVSQSVTEFWRRWHISLSNWLRDYLYVPLGGNRGGALRTYRNLILTMVLGGLWHGANWTFILWGIWHGGLMAVERLLGAKQQATVWPRPLAWPLTCGFLMIGWVMFRAESVGQALGVYQGMLGLNGLNMSAESRLLLQNSEVLFVVLGAVLSVHPLWTPAQVRLCALLRLPAVKGLVTLRVSALFLFCTMLMTARTDSPFLYFQF